MSALPVITFENSRRDFTNTLNKRVNDYFKTNRLDRHANVEMVIKSVAMLVLYFVPFFLVLSGIISGVFPTLLMVVLMSFGLTGIGLSIMHDGNHGAYSKKSWVNKTLGYSLNLIGANAFNWRVQHNVLHHSFTNVYEGDEDISSQSVLRFTPHSPWKWFHRYQFVYAWFLYGLMTLSWMFYKDFKQLLKYHKNGMVKQQKSKPGKEWAILISTKLVYVAYMFLLPLLLTPWLWWQILIGLVIMHYITGFVLAIIFQSAHVIEGSEFPEPDENYSLKDNWAIHQLRTTTNFANNSRWFTWLIGGLNFQIEHHLFPGICHVHYRKLAVIVESTAREFDLPYKSKPTFAKAIRSHQQLLVRLGSSSA